MTQHTSDPPHSLDADNTEKIPVSVALLKLRLQGLQIQLKEHDQKILEQAHVISGLQQRAKELERMATLGLILPGVVHEVNNRLSGALGFTHLLGRSELAQVERLGKMIAMISSELNECARLTRNLVNYSRTLKPALEPVNLAEVVVEVIDAVRVSYEAQHVSINLRLEADQSWVKAILSQVKWVIRTLLDNSRSTLNATGKAGTIHVTMLPDTNHVLLQISDSDGKESDSSRTLESFYVDEASPGPFLGHVVAKSIMKDHGGRIQRIKGSEGGISVLRFPSLEHFPTQSEDSP